MLTCIALNMRHKRDIAADGVFRERTHMDTSAALNFRPFTEIFSFIPHTPLTLAASNN